MSEIIFYLCDLQKHDDLPDEFEFELSESSRVRQQTDPGYLRDDILINSANIFGLDVAEKIERVRFYIGKREIIVNYKVNQNSYMITLLFYDKVQPFINDVGSVRLKIGIQYQRRETCFYSGEIRLLSARMNKNGINNYWVQNVNSAKSMMYYLYEHDPYFDSLSKDIQDDVSHIKAFNLECEFYERICKHIDLYIDHAVADLSMCLVDKTRPEVILASYFNIPSYKTDGRLSKNECDVVYKFLCAVIAHIKHRVTALSCQETLNLNDIDEIPECVMNDYYSGLSDCIYEAFAEIKSCEVNKLLGILNVFQFQRTRLKVLLERAAETDVSESSKLHGYDASYAIIQNDIQRLIKLNQYRCELYLPRISQDIFKHHISLDEIYEYYCLGRIIHSIVKMGFVPDYRPMPTLHQYQVSLKNRLLIRTNGCESDPMVMYSDTSVPNTYHYHSPDESISITVYYQPVIHTRTDISVNGIDIYRYYAEADKNDIMVKYIPMSSFDCQPFEKNQILTPDFLIKREAKGKVFYGILDAKWSLPVDARKMIPDILNKYYKLVYTINEETGCPQTGVPFLWLLAGKNYYSQKDGISEMTEANEPCEVNSLRFKPRYGTGVLPLTPEIGSNALDDLLRPFLFGE